MVLMTTLLKGFQGSGTVHQFVEYLSSNFITLKLYFLQELIDKRLEFAS